MKLLSIFLLISGCANHTLTPEERNEITVEITSTLQSYHADIFKNGLAAEFKYLDSSDLFSWIPPGYKSPINYDSVATILRNNQQAYSYINNKWISLDVIPEDLNHASYQGLIRSEIRDTAGYQSSMLLEEKGKLIRRKHGWKLLSGITRLTDDN